MENKMTDYIKDADMDKLKIVVEVERKYRHGELSLEEAKAELKKHVKVLTPRDVALAEQELKAYEEEQCRKEDIQQMLILFEDILIKDAPELPETHPIAYYYQENQELRKICLEIEDLVQYPVIKNQWLDIYDRLSEIKIHLSRKQNQLYPLLEQKGFDRPTTTMWTLDNFVRDEIAEARELLDSEEEEAFIDMQATVVADIRDLIRKEEEVLYPTSLEMLSKKELEDLKFGDQEIGFSWIRVEPEKLSQKESPERAEGFGAQLSELLQKYGYFAGANQELDVTTGKLTLEQINLIYQHLPIDISFVDENEIVKFYSDTDHRIFPRSKNVIGREVTNCHPRASVHIVKEIVEKFRSGEQDHAEFWINKPGVFIYIYYTAVRDGNGNFKGVLEMMQDCSHIRELQDSRTLLTWENEEQAEEKQQHNPEPELQTETTEKEDIVLQEDTKLSDLLKVYPWLKKELPKISENFKMLNTPLGRVMATKATIKIMSERGEVELETLIRKLKELIESHK